MTSQQVTFRKLAFAGIVILAGFFTSLAVAQPLLPLTAEGSATSDVKPESLPTRASPSSPRGENEEEKRLDQRLLFDLFSPLVGKYRPEKGRSDLTFQNFLTSGWNTGWKEPEEGPQDAPRFRLLRIQRAFWEREVRLFTNYAFGADGGTVDEQELEMEVELPVSRRFLIEFEPSVAGVRPKGGSWDIKGGDLTVIPQLMLWDTKNLSFSSGLLVRTPTGSQSVGGGRTSLTPYLAMWNDLGQRIGLHTVVGTEFPLAGYGPDRDNSIFRYGIAPAKTVTPKDTPLFGNLTFFAELNGTTALGGTTPLTTLTVLPGARWLLFKDFWIAIGYEFPLTSTNEFNSRVWFSIYRDF